MYKWFLILNVLIAFSCNKTSKSTTNGHESSVKQENISTEIWKIELSRSRCRGYCPEYTIIIDQTGNAVLKLGANMTQKGEVKASIEKKTLTNLHKAFEDANFFDYQDEYTSNITDLPTTRISYSKGDQTKTIIDYHGAPDSLKELEKLVDKAVNIDEWIDKSNY